MAPTHDWLELIKELRQKMAGVIEEFDYGRLTEELRGWLASESTWEPLFRSLQASKPAGAGDENGASGREPQVEVWENDEALVMEIGLPSAAKSRELVVETDGHSLQIEGPPPRRGRRFEKRIELPEHVDPSRARAVYRDGVLRISVPKTGSGGRRRIAVEFGADSPSAGTAPPEPRS